jgi:hypothetical protein
MSLAGIETKNNYAGEYQQQYTRPTDFYYPAFSRFHCSNEPTAFHRQEIMGKQLVLTEPMQTART